ncbi:hypothetical protein INR49_004498 [Caranx melampygus]|nr:hypothetical protein INR49_004498 [Caranx melampygus]
MSSSEPSTPPRPAGCSGHPHPPLPWKTSSPRPQQGQYEPSAAAGHGQNRVKGGVDTATDLMCEGGETFINCS